MIFKTTRQVHLHEVATKLDTAVIDVLPALQALACCETTSKICNKNVALKVAESGIIENLVIFGQKQPLMLISLLHYKIFL